MSRNRQPLTALVLGALAMAALAVVAAGPGNRPAAAAPAAGPKPAAGDTSAEALYARAKQAYKEGQRIQALTDALAAHKKDPQDVRVKYLIFLLRKEETTTDTTTDTTTNTGTGTGTGAVAQVAPGIRKAPTMPADEVKALMKTEGESAIRQFLPIQRILERRCATGECHGVTGTNAKWLLALKGTPNDQMLAENFHVVDKYINRETPDQSPLLLKPLGGKETGHPEKAIRGKTDPTYQQVLKYIGTLKTTTEKGDFWKSGAAESAP